MIELSSAAQAVLDAYGDFEAADTDAMAAELGGTNNTSQEED